MTDYTEKQTEVFLQINMKINSIINEDLESIYNSDIDWNRFNNKTILISGANGFLPAYIVETLLYVNSKQNLNLKVIALIRNIKKAEQRFKHYLKNKSLVFLEQDVSLPISIDSDINFLIHAASQASPKFFKTDPVGTLNANVLGTINMVRLALEKKVESLLYFSSAEVYGRTSSNSGYIKEADYGYLDPLNVRSCYAESKRMGENISISYGHQFHLNVKIVRPFHTFGPGMDLTDGRIFADFVRNIVNNEDIIMRSEGNAKRAYCYVTDAAIGYFKVLLEGASGEAYNVGNPFNECSVLELANLLVALYPDKQLRVVKDLNSQPNYLPSPVDRIIPDIEKLEGLGWAPKVSIKEAFNRTISSYLSNEGV